MRRMFKIADNAKELTGSITDMVYMVYSDLHFYTFLNLKEFLNSKLEKRSSSLSPPLGRSWGWPLSLSRSERDKRNQHLLHRDAAMLECVTVI